MITIKYKLLLCNNNHYNNNNITPNPKPSMINDHEKQTGTKKKKKMSMSAAMEIRDGQEGCVVCQRTTVWGGQSAGGSGASLFRM